MLTSRSITARSTVLKASFARVPNVVGSGLISGVRSKPHPVGAASLDVSPSTTSTSRKTDERGFVMNEDGTYDLSAPPPFSLADIRNAIPANCWQKDTLRSVGHLIKDVAIVAGLAVAAFTINAWWAWPIYWMAQGTMFWALFVVGHDCGHQSFSPNRALNDFIGNITHASILVPYHGWRISHRTHHANHGHCENDESWYPAKKTQLDEMNYMEAVGRMTLPLALMAFPAYLWGRSPGKEGSHYDPSCELFAPNERNMILTSNAFMIGMVAILAGATYALGIPAMAALYLVPYLIGVSWLSVTTYLHHHGPSDAEEKIPWYRGEEWSYFRGGLSTIDRDFGIFNKIHHNIETHVIHHLFSQMPHYNLVEATNAAKSVMGPYYREPEKSKGWFPTHLIEPLVRSFKNDHYVEDTGDVVFYKKSEAFLDMMAGKSKTATA
uniref:Omega-3 fatty acid desaturase n=1 Tax=Chlamydomonas sp. ICE-L TaxID=309537 RepID=M1PVS3_9CHLO|nr:omega-3 fatty acid desaturase [Chlamydomonas sp. ICE-L]|eukprot:gene19521-26195_t